MTVADILKRERECVVRNKSGCDRDCEKCDLVLPDELIIHAYDYAISKLEKEESSCVDCVYFDREEWDMPCRNCKLAAKNYFRKNEE